MPYREAAEVPPKETLPPERFVISRYGLYPAIAIVIASLALAAFVAFAFYGRTHLVCVRSAAGAIPRCTAEHAGLGADAVAPFDLRPNTLKTEVHESDDSTTYVIVTPNGKLHKGVDKDFAEKTVARANTFAESPNEMRFEADRANTVVTMMIGFGGVLFVVVMLLIVKRTHLVLDRESGVLRAGEALSYSLSEVKAAKVESIDDSSFYKLILLSKSGSSWFVAEGRESECNAVAKAVNRALAAGHRSTRSMPDELKEEVLEEKRAAERDLTDDEKWQQMETFLRSLPIDGVKIVKNKKDRRIEARGTKRGLPIRVFYDPVSPGGTEIEVKAKGQLGFLDIDYDPDAKPDDEGPADPTWDDPDERRVFFGDGVFVDDAATAKAFRALSADLQYRIPKVMQENDVRYFRIRPDETTIDSREAPSEHADPHAHVSAMLEIAAEAAEAAANATPIEPPEDEEEDEDEDDET